MKVLIAAAGIGSRLGGLTKFMHKTMMPVGKKPVISHIIDSYPANTKFVIALGYRRDHVRQYLDMAHENLSVQYVYVDHFDGPGSGLGLTLKHCAPFPDEPFIFHSSDTIISSVSELFNLHRDTIVLNKRHLDSKKYRSASIDESTGRVIKLHDKSTEVLRDAYSYVGVCYFHNYEAFRDHLSVIDVEFGESHYFASQKELDADFFFAEKWYDIGDIRGLQIAQEELSDFENLNKLDEAIYFRENRVIKYFYNEEIVTKRLERSKILGGLVPQIEAKSPNFYSYNFIDGELLSEIEDVSRVFPIFLDWCKRNLFKEIPLSVVSREMFERNCFDFYYKKTGDRIDQFYLENLFFDHVKTVNGKTVTPLVDSIQNIDWSYMREGVPTLFHGDFHFENIIKTKQGFKLIDWRQSFDTEVKYGDLYYDLAKLYHGLVINHGIIRGRKFTVNGIESGDVTIAFDRLPELEKCETLFQNWITDQGHDLNKVQTLTALIFVNIAPLHHTPYNYLLYFLGRMMLSHLHKGTLSEAVVPYFTEQA